MLEATEAATKRHNWKIPSWVHFFFVRLPGVKNAVLLKMNCGTFLRYFSETLYISFNDNITMTASKLLLSYEKRMYSRVFSQSFKLSIQTNWEHWAYLAFNGVYTAVWIRFTFLFNSITFHSSHIFKMTQHKMCYLHTVSLTIWYQLFLQLWLVHTLFLPFHVINVQ